MKEILILIIPLATMVLVTYIMLQHFYNKQKGENKLKITTEKKHYFFPTSNTGIREE